MPLNEYARGKCWTCDQLPPELLDEINETRRAMHVGPDAVIKWLITEHGYTREQIRRGSLAYHFSSLHHEPR